MNVTRQILLIFLIILLDVIAANGLGVLVAQYVKGLPAEPVLLTGGTALMLAIQLALSPAIGHWSDKKGRRPAAIATVVTSFLSTLLLLVISPWTYVANRLTKGGTNGLYAVMRSSVADIAPKEKLLQYSSLLSYIVGAGIVVGPLFTGWLLYVSPDVQKQPEYLVWLLLGLSAVGVLLVIFALRETNDDTSEVEFSEIKEKAISALKIKTLWDQLGESDKQVPGIKPLFILNMLATLSFGYYSFFVAFLTNSELKLEPLQATQFLMFFGAVALVANVLFTQFGITHVNKRKVVIAITFLNIALQIGYMFSEQSVTLLYVVGGIDALSVSLVGGILGGILSEVTKEGGGQGEVFGNIQALGGVASFTTALVNSLLSGVSMKAPFIFCALSSVVVLYWLFQLPDEARKYTDRISAEQPQEEEPKQGETDRQKQPEAAH